MPETPFNPDDPRLTAYVLGELSAAERADVEDRLAVCAESRRLVDDLRDTTARLFEALQAEPSPALTEAQRASIRAAAIIRDTTPRRSPASATLPTKLRTQASHGQASHGQDSHGQDSHGRAAITALLAVVAVSTAVLAALVVPFDAHHPAQGVAMTLGDGNTDLLALNTDVAHDFTDPVQSHLHLFGVEDLSREAVDQNQNGQVILGVTPRIIIEQLGEEAVPDIVRNPVNSYARLGLAADPTSGPADSSTTMPGSALSLAGVPALSGVSRTPTGVDPEIANIAEDFNQLMDEKRFAEAHAVARNAKELAPDDPNAIQMYIESKFAYRNERNQALGSRKEDRFWSQIHDVPREVHTQARISSQSPREAANGQNDGARTTSPRTAGAAHGRGLGGNYSGPQTEMPPPAAYQPADTNGDGSASDKIGQQMHAVGQPIPANPAGPLPNLATRQKQTPGKININSLNGNSEILGAILDVPFRQGSTELGIPLIGDGIVASNGASPQTGWLYDPLRRNNRELEEHEARSLGLKPIYSGFLIGWAPDTEAYAPIVENPFVSPVEEPLSTFGLDVDTASYANVRRFLMDDRRWPPADAVRIEELVNYFSYSIPNMRNQHPVRVLLEAAACPWDPTHRLVRIGLKGREIDLADRPPTSLVFLIDTSGSMRDENKLSLVKESLRLLVEEMTENDRIALVTYSNDAGLILDSTSGEHRDAIMAVIDSLEANGSTNGEAGLKLAYDVASKHLMAGGTNRVILCTDGDFNVGQSADAPLVRMISEQRDTGVFLSICGFGTGNLKDAKLEQIADHGNGQYHYIDGLGQARKVFLDELSGMLYTIAKDVKLQVEFNPARVGVYRLIGYENRALDAEDFNNDRIDAGDLGAGHSVTALYEVVPPGSDAAKPASETPGVDPLKYQGAGTPPLGAPQREAPPFNSQPLTVNPQLSTELLTVKLRYKPALPVGSRLSALDSDESVKLEFPLADKPGGESPSADLQWAAAVASFGMILRNSSYRGQSSIEGVLELARGAMGDDPTGDRHEFIELVLQARSLFRKAAGTASPRPPQLSSREARDKASVGGRYQKLLDKFDRPADFDRYGDYYDAGRKDASDVEGHPAGYWVYVFPHWYVWDETTPVSNAAPIPAP